MSRLRPGTAAVVLCLAVALVPSAGFGQAPPPPAGQAPPTPGAGPAVTPRPLPPMPGQTPRSLAERLQVPAEAAAQRPAAPPAAPVSITLEAGAGRLLQLTNPAITVMAADPRIARVQPASPTSLFVMAVAAGGTTVVALAEDGSPVAQFDITVQPNRAQREAALAAAPPSLAPAALATPRPNPAAVQSMIRRLVRGTEGVQVSAAGPNTLVLTGQVPTAADAQRAEAIARGYGGEDREVINSLALLSSIQVNLRVRVAEISRQVSRELGFN